MAIGDTLNQNLFGTNYNAEDEERRKAELAAQGAIIGAENSFLQSPDTPSNLGGALPSATPTIDSILNSRIGAFQPGAVNFSNPPEISPTMSAPANFNLNNQDPQGNFGQTTQNPSVSFGEIESQMTSPNAQPIISSTPSPGLEPFNRYNPTTQQFEQMFGNQSAQLPSSETFVEGQTGFNDAPRFLQSIRDEAQKNALNFIGQPVTQNQLNQANRLAEEIGVTPNFQVDANGNLVTAEYGTDFKQRSPEEFNRLLNMRNIQNRQASVNTPEFQQAMAERDAALQESRASFQQASDDRIDRLKNQPGFNDTFNYDKDGNKVLAGGSAGGEEMSQSEARDIAAAEASNATEADIARGFLVKSRVDKRLKNIELDKSTNAVKNFFTANDTGKELNLGDVRMLIEATGSPQAAIESYGNLKESLSEKQLNDFNRSVANINAFGAELETPKMFKKLDDKSTRMLALNQKTGNWGSVDINGEFQKVNIDDYRETAYSEISTAKKSALDMQTEIFTDVSGITQLEKFKADRIDSQEGLAQFITSVQDRFKTAFGMPISEQGMKDAIAKAGFERLLGVIRLDVLGPGVLTEQDAQRLIAAMGGFGGLADRETSVKLVERLIKSKERAAQGRMTVYNQTKGSFKELQDELPNITMDNVESIRRGDFLNPNNSSDSNDLIDKEIDALFTPKS
jgi:hypothetical protein